MTFDEIVPFVLRDYQKQTIEQIDLEKNYLITQPTGSGKTLIAEYFMYNALKNGKRVIYTSPLKALASEKYNEWKNNNFYLNKEIAVFPLLDTGDVTNTRLNNNNFYNGMWNILITTNERLDVIIRKKELRNKILKDVDYIIIDEVHLLGSHNRGGTIEYLILVLKKFFPEKNIIGLSATLPNAEEIATWMNATLINIPEKKRPVPLEEIIEKPHQDAISSKERVSYKYRLLKKHIRKHKDKQFLIFTSSRQRAEDITTKIIIDLGINAAYHHAGLTYEERRSVENKFLSGDIKIVVSTPTLAQGINLPATFVVLFDLSRWNGFKSENELIEDYEILQMRGRAGRPQFDKKGYCIYLGSYKEINNIRRIINRQQPIKSKIQDVIDDKILALVSSGICFSREEIYFFMYDTLAMKQKSITDKTIEDTINSLLDNKFLKEENGMLLTTKTGNFTSKMYLKPITIIDIYNNIKKLPENPTYIEILKAFLSNWELLSNVRINTFDYKYISKSKEKYNITTVHVTAYDPYSKRIKLMNLSSELSKLMKYLLNKDFKEKIYVSSGDLYSMRMFAKSIIDRAFAVLNSKIPLSYKEIKIIKQFLDHETSNKNLAELLSISNIGEKTIEKLKKNRINSIKDFLKTSTKSLKKMLTKTSDSIEKMKKEMIKNFPEYKHFYKQEKTLIDFFQK